MESTKGSFDSGQISSGFITVLTVRIESDAQKKKK